MFVRCCRVDLFAVDSDHLSGWTDLGKVLLHIHGSIYTVHADSRYNNVIFIFRNRSLEAEEKGTMRKENSGTHLLSH